MSNLTLLSLPGIAIIPSADSRVHKTFLGGLLGPFLKSVEYKEFHKTCPLKQIYIHCLKNIGKFGLDKVLFSTRWNE